MDACRLLTQKGYTIYATEGTHKFLQDNDIPSIRVYWPHEEGKPQAVSLLQDHTIDLVVNINKNLSQGELTNGYKLRRSAIDLNIPLITNARLASAFITAFCRLSADDIQIKPWSEYK